MSPTGIAVIFGILAAAAGYGLWRDVKTGVARDEIYSFRRDENPVGFMATMAGKLFVMAFGVAEILHAMNLCGDPMVPLRSLFG